MAGPFLAPAGCRGGVSRHASVHLGRLKAERSVDVLVQGRHRYYSSGRERREGAGGAERAAGAPPPGSRPTSSDCAARTCYDHMAGGRRSADRLHRSSGWRRSGAKALDHLIGTGAKAARPSGSIRDDDRGAAALRLPV